MTPVEEKVTEAFSGSPMQMVMFSLQLQITALDVLILSLVSTHTPLFSWGAEEAQLA